MSASQVLMVVAGATVVVPVVVALGLIAVDRRVHPRFARVRPGIDDRSPSASRPARRESPECSEPVVVTPVVASNARVDLGPQALRDAVDSRHRRGAEVFG